MRRAGLALIFVVFACAARPDPRVEAARDFKNTAWELVGRDEQQTKRLNSLRLGMSDGEALKVAGPPTRRESRTTSNGRSVEVWSYNGELKFLGTLSFEDQKLVQIQVN